MDSNIDIEHIILKRRSSPKLVAPAPDTATLERLISAAITAPDHGRVRPWRFLVIEGAGLDALGELFVHAETLKGQTNTDRLNTLRNQPHRAPLIVTVIATLEKEHAIPEVERQVAVGCAVQNFILLAEAFGFGTYWRTGPMAYDETVKQGLGLSSHESIIGFVYVGTPAAQAKERPEQSVSEVLHRWVGGAVTSWS